MRLAHTVADAADEASVSQDVIRDAINRRALPAKRNGRRLLIRRVDLEAWVDGLEDA